jgi:adenylate kinase family enzyme
MARNSIFPEHDRLGPGSNTKLEAKRILVYGVCGAGKTTFARRLSERTGITWTSVDDLTHLPGWVVRSDEFQIAEIEKICAGETWILDSAYRRWVHLPLSRADLIVGLDYPRWFSFLRLLRRTAKGIIFKTPLCNGNQESLRQALSRKSILLWHFQTFNRKRQRIRQWAADPSMPRVIVFGNAREAEKWLEQIGPTSEPAGSAS